MSVMGFQRLAPHRGLVPVMGHYIGNSEMRGGFSWSGFLSGISSGLNRFGGLLSQASKSEAFKQVKNGIVQSGVLENVGNLAASAVNGLVDAGRIKLERDIQRLKEKAAGNAYDTRYTTETAFKNEDQNDRMDTSYNEPPPIVEVLPSQSTEEPVLAGPSVPEVPEAVPLGPYMPSARRRRVTRPVARARKRRASAGWGAALGDMVGHGPDFYKRRYCF